MITINYKPSSIFINKNIFALCRDSAVWTANSQDGTTPKAPVSTFVACSIVVTVFELITINYKLSSIFKQKCFCALSWICGLKLQMSKYLGKVCEHHKLSSETLLSSRPLKPLKIVKKWTNYWACSSKIYSLTTMEINYWQGNPVAWEKVAVWWTHRFNYGKNTLNGL